MTIPERPADLLGRARDRLLASHAAIKQASADIAAERAQQAAPDQGGAQQPAKPPTGN